MDSLVSIITPSYNTAKYIANTIESVQNQTYSNWEMIIVDDGSTDDTDEVVKNYLNDSRIRYLKNEKNLGAALSRNYGLREAKGRWIAFLDSDDLWYPEKLEKQINFMNKGNYSFSYTKYEEMNEEGYSLDRIISGPKKITKRIMFSYCYPGCLTVMYDQKKIGKIQLKGIKKNNDYALWLQISKKVDCYLLDENLAKYRKREGSISRYNIGTMILWHYKLWNEEMEYKRVTSLILTGINIIFGSWKKINYVNKVSYKNNN